MATTHSTATPPAPAGTGVPLRIEGPGSLVADGVDLAPALTALSDLGAVGSPQLSVSSGFSLPPSEVSDLLATVVSLRAALAAVETRAVVALEDTMRSAANRHRDEAGSDAPEVDEKLVRRSSSREASMLSQRSPASAAHRLSASRRLVRHFPRMLTALAQGKISEDVAFAVGRTSGPVAPDLRGDIDEALAGALPYLEGAGVRQWTREVEALAHRKDPEGADRRYRVAVKERGVTVRPGAHGMATMSVRLPGIDAALVRKRLSLEAERLRAAGDRRGHQAIMADSLVDTVIGRVNGMDPVQLDLGVIVTDRALLSPERGDAATIPGYGCVPFEQVRSCLRETLDPPRPGTPDPLGPDGEQLRAVFRLIWTHPSTDEVVAIQSRARAFPEVLRRFVHFRDITCRGPFCDAEIRQVDHIRPHSRGGPTSLENANGLCASCNTKETFTRSVAIERRVRWTSLLGTRVSVGPVAVGPGPLGSTSNVSASATTPTSATISASATTPVSATPPASAATPDSATTPAAATRPGTEDEDAPHDLVGRMHRSIIRRMDSGPARRRRPASTGPRMQMARGRPRIPVEYPAPA